MIPTHLLQYAWVENIYNGREIEYNSNNAIIAAIERDRPEFGNFGLIIDFLNRSRKDKPIYMIEWSYAGIRGGD